LSGDPTGVELQLASLGAATEPPSSVSSTARSRKLRRRCASLWAIASGVLITRIVISASSRSVVDAELGREDG